MFKNKNRMDNTEYKNLFKNNIVPIKNYYAGIGSRFVAFLIDGVIISFVFGFISFVTGIELNSGLLKVIYNPAGILSFLLAMSYFVYFETTDKQATLGKQAMGLKVVKQNGAKMTMQDAVIRYIGKILSAFILMIGFIMAIIDDQKQSLHDRLATTFVVNV